MGKDLSNQTVGQRYNGGKTTSHCTTITAQETNNVACVRAKKEPTALSSKREHILFMERNTNEQLEKVVSTNKNAIKEKEL